MPTDLLPSSGSTQEEIIDMTTEAIEKNNPFINGDKTVKELVQAMRGIDYSIIFEYTPQGFAYWDGVMRNLANLVIEADEHPSGMYGQFSGSDEDYASNWLFGEDPKTDNRDDAITGLEQELANRDEQITFLKARIASLEGYQTDLEQRLDERRDEVVELQRRNDTQAATIQYQDELLLDNSRQIEALVQQIESLKSTNGSLERELAGVKKEDLANEVRRLNSANTKLLDVVQEQALALRYLAAEV